MLALLPVIVLAAAKNPCLEARQLEENKCIEVLVALDFKNAGNDESRLDRYPGVDPYSFAPDLIDAPIPGLDSDPRYWRVCFQQLWEANRSATENEECKEPLERTLHERVARARVDLEAKARRAFRRFRSRDGFGALRWGMSESELRARVPEAHPSTVGLTSLGTQYGREAMLSYYLLSDRLVRVDVLLRATSSEEAFDIFKTIAKTYEKQFGDPFIVGERAAWIVGQTRHEVVMVNIGAAHGVKVMRQSLELETWALKLRGRDTPGVGNASMNHSL